MPGEKKRRENDYSAPHKRITPRWRRALLWLTARPEAADAADSGAEPCPKENSSLAERIIERSNGMAEMVCEQRNTEVASQCCAAKRKHEQQW